MIHIKCIDILGYGQKGFVCSIACYNTFFALLLLAFIGVVDLKVLYHVMYYKLYFCGLYIKQCNGHRAVAFVFIILLFNFIWDQEL